MDDESYRAAMSAPVHTSEGEFGNTGRRQAMGEAFDQTEMYLRAARRICAAWSDRNGDALEASGLLDSAEQSLEGAREMAEKIVEGDRR